MSIDRTKYMSLEEVHKLRDYAEKKGGVAWLVVDMALSTGLRVGELAKIQISDIDFERKGLTVIRLKKRKKIGKKKYIPLRKPEFIPLSDNVLEHLRSSTTGRAGALFVGQRGQLTPRGLQQIWKTAVKKAGLNGYSIHSSRHTIAVHLLKKTKNLRLVQKQLGHSSPATTANMYADVTFEDLQNSLNNLY